MPYPSNSSPFDYAQGGGVNVQSDLEVQAHARRKRYESKTFSRTSDCSKQLRLGRALSNGRLSFAPVLDAAKTQHNNATASTRTNVVTSSPIGVREYVKASCLRLPAEEDHRARFTQEVTTKSDQLLPRCCRRRIHVSTQFFRTGLGVGTSNSNVVKPSCKGPVTSSGLPHERHKSRGRRQQSWNQLGSYQPPLQLQEW